MRVSVRSSSARRARALQDALADAGVEATAFVGPGGARRPMREDVAILDAMPEARAWAVAEARALNDAPARPAAILAASEFDAPPDDSAGFDGWLRIDGPAALVRRDIAAAHRSGVAREELAIRAATAAAGGRPHDLAGVTASWRTLFIGEPHPFFLTLERAMGREGGRLEAAFSSFMGFDFLHDDRFDAVALNANADAATALALCGALRRNARLHHLPTLMLADAPDASFAASAIDRGASLVIDRSANHDTAIAWLFASIRAGRSASEVEAGLTTLRAACAGATTLFAPDIFQPHVDALARAAHTSGRPLSLVGLRITLAPGARVASASGWRRGVSQVAEICGRLIRAEDTAALLDGDVIVIALPGADAREAGRTAERVASVTECTAFAAGETDAGPIMLAQCVHELAAGESGAALLARTRAVFDAQDVRA